MQFMHVGRIAHSANRYISDPPVAPSVVRAAGQMWTDALIAVAPWVRDELLAMGIGSEERWHVVPMGVNLDPLLRSRVDARTARTRLGLPLDVPIVGCVGRLVALKDHATFFQAAICSAVSTDGVRA